VRLLRIIDPPSRTVLVYRNDGSIMRVRDEEDLSGESVLPGFRCPVSELFRSAPPAANQPADW
jgi:Uma2 family endonuclease